MTTRPFAVELLGPQHARATFGCGVDALDRYLKQQASQDVRRHITACYVARDTTTGTTAGYYTLAAGSVLLSDVPEAIAKRLPRYPAVPVARVGRLAVGTGYQGRKLGAALLWDAVLRAHRSEVAVFAIVVDAKNDSAAAFYRHLGFLELRTNPNQLFLPLSARKQPAR